MLAAEGKSEDPGKGKLLKLVGIGLLVAAALWMVYLLVA